MENEVFIKQEIDWLTKIIISRLELYFNKETEIKKIKEIEPQTASIKDGAYANFIVENRLNFEDRVYLALTMAPILKPQLMDCFNFKNTNTDQRFVEFGCFEVDQEKGIRPSLETILFLLASDDIVNKIRLKKYFTRHKLFTSHLFRNDISFGEMNQALVPSLELVDNIIFERHFSPDFSTTFPARRITTSRSWSDLIVDSNTMKQINEIKLWLNYGERILDDWDLRGKVKMGYRALFYGPSGTGKTFTASLLGKHTGKDVYCVDLSMVVSKYIGETEKNLSQIFATYSGVNPFRNPEA